MVPSASSLRDRDHADPGEVERLLADVGKAARLLDWTPRVTLEQGLRATIEWIASHQGRYRPDEYAV